MKVTAIIMNGRHGGTQINNFNYNPTIKLPISKDSQISIGETYDNSVRMGDIEEYKECFRSVDKMCVLYSTTGKWSDIKYGLKNALYLKETYPIKLF